MKNLHRNEKIAVVIGIVVVGFFFIFGQYFVNFYRTGSFMTNTDINTASTTPQVVKQDVVVGTGDEAVAGTKVTVHYTGQFTNGKVFDSSVTRGTPFTFILGTGQVIKGWDQGIEGMKVGGKRVLVVPPELGYGTGDYGPIPANSTLVFQVELLKVEK
jgi:FKBP-type peptidyl-prolyl cis-trans isomerase